MKPMLAATIRDIKDVRFPVYASAKLDGIRAMVIDGKLYARSLKRIPNRYTQELFSHRHLNGLDGELILGRPTAKNVFRKTQSAVSTEKWEPAVIFYVFDNFERPALRFADRMKSICGKVSTNMAVLQQVLVHNVAQLLEYEEQKLREGFEGLILRSPDGAYKYGRSTMNEQGMMKLKRFVTREAYVRGVKEEKENTNPQTVNELGRNKRSSHKAGKVGKGRAGALELEDCETGVEFDCGSGMDDKEREWFWNHRFEVVKKNTIVRYKSFLIGVKDKPRFPSFPDAAFDGIRNEWDM